VAVVARLDKGEAGDLPPVVPQPAAPAVYNRETVVARVPDHILDGVVGVAECEGGVRVVGVELIDERSQPLVEETHHPVHLVNALSLMWGQAGGPQPGNAAQRAHIDQHKLPQPDAVQSLMN
jgi:hypothetical protein